MRIKSFAKINLTLRVLKKLKNKMHDIETNTMLVDLYDEINLKKNKRDVIIFNGKFKSNVNLKKNTIIDTLFLLRKLKIIKSCYKITVKKNIPVYSGLGGGTSNSVSIVKYFLKNKIKEKFIRILEQKIGSDFRLFLNNSSSENILASGTTGFGAYKNLVINAAQHIFKVSNVQKVLIDSSGRLLVGAAAIQYASSPLYVSGTAPVVGQFHHSDGGTNDQARISLGALANNPPSNRGVNLVAENNGNGHDFVVQCSASHAAGPSEKLRINSSGTLFMGKSSQSSSTPGVELYQDGPNFMTRTAVNVLGLNVQGSSQGDIMRFYYQDSHEGSLNYNGSTFTATTASDYRLKENDTPITDGIERVKRLRPIKFNWKKDPSTTYDGFIAHEVQEIVPDCVIGEKDAEISEKGEGYQHISKEGLIPLLTAALKEEIAKREALEARIAALEGS